MTILQIQYFVDVAKYRSFSAAAEKNFVSQPTVSNIISSLEAETGCQLLYRGKPLELTPEGREYLYYCTELLEHYDSVNRFRKPISHTVRIGIPPMLSAMMLPEIVRKAGEIRFSLHEHYFTELIRDLKNGAIDLMFHYDTWVKDPSMEIKRIRPMRRMLSAHRHFVLPRDRVLEAGDLKGIPLALRSTDTQLNKLVRDQLAGASLEPEIICETDQIKTLETLVRAGICAAFLDQDLFPYDPHVLSYPYKVNSDALYISVIYRKGTAFPPHIRQFINSFPEEKTIISK